MKSHEFRSYDLVILPNSYKLPNLKTIGFYEYIYSWSYRTISSYDFCAKRTWLIICFFTKYNWARVYKSRLNVNFSFFFEFFQILNRDQTLPGKTIALWLNDDSSTFYYWFVLSSVLNNFYRMECFFYS